MRIYNINQKILWKTIVVIIIVWISTMIFFVTTKAEETGGFRIENSILTKYNGNDKKVTIPDAVIRIGKRAFYNNKRLHEVIIPDTVTRIDTEAFGNCSKLNKITIEDSVVFIAENAFSASNSKLIISCYKDSYAYEYAKTNKIKIKLRKRTGTDLSLYADFRVGEPSGFIASDGWSNGWPFNCIWRSENISFQKSGLGLTIKEDALKDNYLYSGGEYRSVSAYSYGKYEVSMKPIKNDGVVSSFFIYTGPNDNNPWDEIDIEFLGKDTTKVQFNYYTNGLGSHEYVYDLGFDAANNFHVYGFVWEKNSIVWYVDGIPVYTASDHIPTTPAKVMMNVWPGTGVADWLKDYDGTVPLTACYQWVRVTREN